MYDVEQLVLTASRPFVVLFHNRLSPDIILAECIHENWLVLCQCLMLAAVPFSILYSVSTGAAHAAQAFFMDAGKQPRSNPIKSNTLST
jgi:hypothetical protein